MAAATISLLVMLSLVGFVHGWPYFPLWYTHVLINNTIPGEFLTIHCNYHADDRGVHVIAPSEQYKFQFKPNVWGTTKFSCSFGWSDVSHHFNIYVQSRDYDNCDKNCKWLIKSEGPCYIKSDDFCDLYQWD
ncbi:hypothetical protein MLD38_037298 [Melastoma candidum]|uniref:Uncharacterized protein n=1 Tax=Melastoma candidum TaxID=119954 RepID=A0ACB9LMC4_9MYRT|nr:hypothetical protein MLD38_037298 [Melastoma candidum]